MTYPLPTGGGQYPLVIGTAKYPLDSGTAAYPLTSGGLYPLDNDIGPYNESTVQYDSASYVYDQE